MAPINKPECDQKGGIFYSFLNEAGGPEVSDPKGKFCTKLGLDCNVLKELGSIDATGSEDGCVTLDEYTKKFPYEESSKNEYNALRYRSTDLAYRLALVADREWAIANSSAINQVFLKEAEDPARIMATRIDLVEELLHVINAGYLVRDQYRAHGGIKALWDIITFGRKIALWQDDNSMTGLWKEWAEGSFVNRERAVAKFIEQLRNAEAIGEGTTDAAIKAVKDGIDTDHEQCAGWFGQMFYDCADEIINDDYPTELIQRILTLPEGDTKGLAAVLMEMGSWLDTVGAIEERANWVAAQYIYEQVKDNAGVIGTEIAQEANKRAQNIYGRPENRSPFWAALLPAFPWEYGDLSRAQQYTIVEDWLSFGLGMAAGGKATQAIMNSLGTVISNLLARSPRLKAFADAIKPKRLKTGAATGSATKGVAAEGAAAVETTAPKGFKARVRAFFDTSQFKFNSSLARGGVWSLNRTGQLLYGSWYYSFGALGRGIRAAAPYVVAVVKPTVDAVRTAAVGDSFFMPPAWLITKTFQGTGWVIKTLGRGLPSDWKSYAPAWWALSPWGYGAPFVRGMPQAKDDMGFEPMKKAVCEYETDWAIQQMAHEIEYRDIPMNSKRVLIMELDRTRWEEGRRKQTRHLRNCDVPPVTQDGAGGPVASLLYEMSEDSLYSAIGFVYMGKEGTFYSQGKKIDYLGPLPVIPAKAGISLSSLDSRVRGNDMHPDFNIFNPSFTENSAKALVASLIGEGPDTPISIGDLLPVSDKERSMSIAQKYNYYLIERDGHEYLMAINGDFEDALSEILI